MGVTLGPQGLAWLPLISRYSAGLRVGAVWKQCQPAGWVRALRSSTTRGGGWEWAMKDKAVFSRQQVKGIDGHASMLPCGVLRGSSLRSVSLVQQ